MEGEVGPGNATPTSCPEARRFIGLANCYRRFVEGYAEVAAPLTVLGSPTARFAWAPEPQTSFEALKQALPSAPVLRAFDPRRRAVLATDASSLAVAAILTQPDDEGHQHSVAYESRKLTNGTVPLTFWSCLRWCTLFAFSGVTCLVVLRLERKAARSTLIYGQSIRRSRVSFEVTHLPGARNPTDPLSRRGFADCDGAGLTTGDWSPRVNRSSFRATAGIRHHRRFLQLCGQAGARHAE